MVAGWPHLMAIPIAHRRGAASIRSHAGARHQVRQGFRVAATGAAGRP
jgi:hypothetical protein